MNKLIILLFAATTYVGTMAQNDTLPEGFLINIDSTMAQWQAQKFLHFPANVSTNNTNTNFPDSVYAQRLALLPTIIPMTYNKVVRTYIDNYFNKGRQRVSYLLGAANFYIPIFEETLDRYGLPLELKYLPIIESGLSPTVTSKSGASGLWQFIITTSKGYGLETNSLIDERRDVFKSTDAAARYLKSLYAMFNDWTLALAAYNCGPANVNKAIARAGNTADYWKIYQFLPSETRGYVPAFIAANYMMNYYCEHGVVPMEADINFNSDTIHISRRLNLNQVAGALGTDIAILRTLNPAYKMDIIPAGNYTLRLPSESITKFISLTDSIYNYNAIIYSTPITVVEIANEASTTISSSTSNTKRTHIVKKGESLGIIARKYKTTVSKLRSLNGLRGTAINQGQKLRVK